MGRYVNKKARTGYTEDRKKPSVYLPDDKELRGKGQPSPLVTSEYFPQIILIRCESCGVIGTASFPDGSFDYTTGDDIMTRVKVKRKFWCMNCKKKTRVQPMSMKDLSAKEMQLLKQAQVELLRQHQEGVFDGKRL